MHASRRPCFSRRSASPSARRPSSSTFPPRTASAPRRWPWRAPTSPRAGRGPRPTPWPRRCSRARTSPRRTCGRSCRCSRHTDGRTSSSGRSRRCGRRGWPLPRTWSRSAPPTRSRASGRSRARRWRRRPRRGRTPPALLLALARVAYRPEGPRRARSATSATRGRSAPQDPRVHFFIGMVCVALDLGGEAYTALAEAVRLDPGQPRRRTTRSAPWPCTARTRRRRSPTSGATPS